MSAVDVQAPKSTLIGNALVSEGQITQDQLDRALKIQNALEQKRPLGEVLIELGYTTRKTISEIIVSFGKSMRLGDILLEQGLIHLGDLETALNVQQESGKALGEVLIDLGILNERTLAQNLANQSQVPYIEPSFGMIDPRVIAGISPDYLDKHVIVPFCQDDDENVTVIVTDIADETVIAAVEELYKDKYSLALGPRDAIKQTIGDIRQFRVRKTDEAVQRDTDEDNPIVLLVNHIFSQAIDERASDIHIEPLADTIRVRFRIDGALVLKTDLPKNLLSKILSRIKILAECNITEVRRHQGGRLHYAHRGEEYDMRLSCYVTVHGDCAVIRVLHKQMGLVGLDELGMAPTMLERYRKDVLDLPSGVVIITGPTGSGKTTTLYSSLDYCNKIDLKIATVEDPVEFVIDGLIQCSVEEAIGRSFESSLREIVRQDPDIIVLGEIRDKLTAETAIQAALTGHKVYTTFHTEDTIGGLVRLLNMDIEAFLISSTVISIVAQRLLRRICEFCKEPYLPTAVELGRLELDHAEIRQFEFYKGRGCKQCVYTGHRGRVAVYELLILNDAVKGGILAKKPAHEIRQIGVETTGLVSMREDGIAKVIRGMTTFDEVLKKTPATFQTRTLSHIISLTK